MHTPIYDRLLLKSIESLSMTVFTESKRSTSNPPHIEYKKWAAVVLGCTDWVTNNCMKLHQMRLFHFPFITTVITKANDI